MREVGGLVTMEERQAFPYFPISKSPLQNPVPHLISKTNPTKSVFKRGASSLRPDVQLPPEETARDKLAWAAATLAAVPGVTPGQHFATQRAHTHTHKIHSHTE